MSITFTPHAGTWTQSTYFPDQDEESGFYVACTEQPSINCHNSGGYLLQLALGLEADDCGTIPAEGIQAALDSFQDRKRLGLDEHDARYLLNKAEQVEQMLFHCLYHSCGLSFG